MGISEAKKQIVIDNYFKNTCDINTSIKEAFTKGFEVGLTKAVFTKDQYEVRLKTDMVAILDKIKEKIKENTYFINETTEKEGIDFETVAKIIDKYTAEKE